FRMNSGGKPARTGMSEPHTHLARKRRSAPAGLTRVRIHKNESLLHQCFLIIEGHSVQIDERFRVHEKSDVPELKNAVTFARLRVEPNVVAQARASAALNTHAQAALLR